MSFLIVPERVGSLLQNSFILTQLWSQFSKKFTLTISSNCHFVSGLLVQNDVRFVLAVTLIAKLLNTSHFIDPSVSSWYRLLPFGSSLLTRFAGPNMTWLILYLWTCEAFYFPCFAFYHKAIPSIPDCFAPVSSSSQYSYWLFIWGFLWNHRYDLNPTFF